MRSFLVIFVLAFITAGCGGKTGDPKVHPFYKVFTGTVDGRQMLIHLYRDTASSSVSYSGYVADTLTEMYSGGIGGVPRDSADVYGLSFSYSHSKDTSYAFKGMISENGERIDGKMTAWLNMKPVDSFSCLFTEYSMPDVFEYYSGALDKRFSDSGYNYSLRVGFVWPVNFKDSIAERKIRRKIGQLLHIKDTAASPLQTLMEKKFKEAEGSYGKMKPFTGYNGPVSSMVSDEIGLLVFNRNDSRIVLSYYYNHYETGMNHPQWSDGYYTFDMKSGELLKLNDVLDSKAIRKLPALLAKYLRKQKSLASDEPLTKIGLYRNYLPPNNNYYITSKNIVFHYNNYEIAPFSVGNFTIAIPLAELY